MSLLAYLGNDLDRSANQRSDEAWLNERRITATSRLVRLKGDSVLIVEESISVSGMVEAPEAVYLGRDGSDVHWFAAPGIEEGPYRDLRGLTSEGTVPDRELGILAHARSLLHWHSRHRFCSNCGSPTEMRDAGYRRHCPSCGSDHFPRTDPVVIMVARHEGRLLLGRQSSWAPGMYSALAGFMEPGETIENAARREVFEESGIQVGQISYVASQPWPFPANLMIGLIGEALTSDIVIDKKELEDARWFSADDIRAMLAGTHPQGFTASRPTAIAHHLIQAALQPG
ncbi:NAD(+) diphosphatase [Aestuariivirga sp.]|uniref:NAD(+) diphosphatase n=1 Tax=Aestuariivirga sp. TaxID=2650926 RepID=UPI0039E64FCD